MRHSKNSGLTQYLATPVVLIACAVWACAVAGGTFALWNYAHQSSQLSQPSFEWPKNTTLTRQQGQSALVMFAHSECPCTHASAVELAELLAKVSHPVTVNVVFVLPPYTTGMPDCRTWAEVRRIPQATTSIDTDLSESIAFGASTSGEVFLYDGEARLVFHGGITASRAHQGESVGGIAVCRLLQGLPCNVNFAPVYGCPLTAEEAM